MGDRFASLPIFTWHKEKVHVHRVERIKRGIVSLVPSAKSMLDIGCGDGTLAKSVASAVGASDDLQGVDVLVRPNAMIRVVSYDGLHLPFDSERFDLVTICDVLHHASDPGAVLQEAIRVLSPSGALVIKDHFSFGSWSKGVLWAMDVIGNYAPGVLVRGDYRSPTAWLQLVTESGGAVDQLVHPFQIHDAPWCWVARSEYQFLMRATRV